MSTLHHKGEKIQEYILSYKVRRYTRTPALTKALTTHLKKYLIFSQSKVVCRNFFRIMAVKTLKNPYRLQTMTFKLS